MKVKVGSLSLLSLWCVLVCLLACLFGCTARGSYSSWTRDQSCASNTGRTVLTPEPLEKVLGFELLILAFPVCGSVSSLLPRALSPWTFGEEIGVE